MALLHELGVPVSADACDDGRTPLHAAVDGKQYHIITYLINEAYPAMSIHSFDSKGATVLHQAAKDGDMEMIRFLLMNTRTMWSVRSQEGYTALHYAAFTENMEMVKYLIELDRDDVNVNVQSNNGSTPMFLAARVGNRDIVELLNENGGDPELSERVGKTPIYIAAQHGHIETVRYLAKSTTADADHAADQGWTALLVAAEGGNLNIVQALIDAGCVDVNLTNINGASALYLASQNGHMEVVKCLLAGRADCLIQRNDGKRAVDIAEIKGHSAIVELLTDVVSSQNTFCPGVTLMTRIPGKWHGTYRSNETPEFRSRGANNE